jgi:putative Ca2+/H+ antiporter (TMEM165/GDT1 family)
MDLTPLISTFGIIAAAEFGDKTQLSIIALAARYGAPVLIFLGMILAYVMVMGIAVIVGDKLLRLLPPRYLRIFAGALFVFFGVVFMLSAAGINIL